MNLNYSKVKHNGNNYYVFFNKYNKKKVPIVVDTIGYNIIKKLKKNWHINKYNFVYCKHKHNNTEKEIYLHELVLKYQNKQNDSIVHINKIGLDNRIQNLMYDNDYKEMNKCIKKKKRTINLPKNYGIKKNEIPTYVTLLRENEKCGARFMVNIGDISWKTTSKRNLSLKYKLEEAKFYLRKLKEEKPELFDEYSMNGDYTKYGKKLFDEFYTIIDKAGFKNFKRLNMKNNTDILLQNKMEEFNYIDDMSDLIRLRTYNSLPKNCNIKFNDIPNYCHYKNCNKGCYFMVVDHPKQDDEIFYSNDNKNCSLKNKLKEIKNYLKELK